MAVSRYVTLRAIKHSGNDFSANTPIALSDEYAAPLLAIGAIQVQAGALPTMPTVLGDVLRKTVSSADGGTADEYLKVSKSDQGVEVLIPKDSLLFDVSGVPKSPDTSTFRTSCYSFDWPGSNSTARYLERHFYVPVGSGTDYFGVVVGDRKITTGAQNITDMLLARPGIEYKSSGCNRIGSWTQVTGIAGSFWGEYYWSTTPGDTISKVVTGSAVHARLYHTSNGGYGIVSIDGSYDLPNRLPRFTAPDLAAGRCRAQDVGRPYVQCKGTQWSDAYPLADNLTDTAHTVKIEAVGLDSAGATGARLTVESIAGCSAADIAPNAATNTHMMPICYISHLSGSWAAFAWVASYSPTLAGEYKFIGDTHADGTDGKEIVVAPPVITVDGTDRSAFRTDLSYVSGTMITWSQSSNVYHKADMENPALAKKRMFTFMANRPLPMMAEVSGTWSIAGYLAYSYPTMLHIGCQDNMFGGAMQMHGLKALYLGKSRLSDFSKTDNSLDYVGEGDSAAGVPRLVAVADKFVAWADLVSDYPARSRMYSAKGRLVRQSRNSADQKCYIADVSGSRQPVSAGETFRYVMGWGAIPI